MALTRALAPQMKERKWGRIIHISSIMGFVSKGGRAPYSATKSALIGFAKGCAIDLGTFGITVNCICPGPILTAMTDGIPEKDRETYARRRTALRRYGRPEEVAHMTLSLCLPAASFITGATIPVDGGLMAPNAETYKPPRTAYGAPDLQGVWDNDSMTRLQRPKDFKALIATPYEAQAFEAKGFGRYAMVIAPVSPDEPAPSDDKVTDDDRFERPRGLARINGEIRSSQITHP
eukprot:gene57664-76966_t